MTWASSSRPLVVLALPLVLFAGCKSQPPQLVPVRGKIMCGDKPLAGVMVQFVPQDPERKHLVADGQTDKEGVFTLRTYPFGEGAVIGKYKVTLNFGSDGDDPSAIEEMYSNPESTPLEAEIKEGGADNLVFTIPPDALPAPGSTPADD